MLAEGGFELWLDLRADSTALPSPATRYILEVLKAGDASSLRTSHRSVELEVEGRAVALYHKGDRLRYFRPLFSSSGFWE